MDFPFSIPLFFPNLVFAFASTFFAPFFLLHSPPDFQAEQWHVGLVCFFRVHLLSLRPSRFFSRYIDYTTGPLAFPHVFSFPPILEPPLTDCRIGSGSSPLIPSRMSRTPFLALLPSGRSNSAVAVFFFFPPSGCIRRGQPSLDSKVITTREPDWSV